VRQKKRHTKPTQPIRANQKPKGYDVQTRLVHGFSKTRNWDYTHHVVPPITSSAAFRLNSTQRGAKGFFEFACDHIDTTRQIPIYIYDRLDEPTRGMLEENLAMAEGGEMAVCFATGMAAISAAICMQVRAGEEILAHEILYGCTYSLFTNWMPRQEVRTRFVTCATPTRLTKL
jgi:methionine-gamma-lyase